jgi:hypothetical protein
MTYAGTFLVHVAGGFSNGSVRISGEFIVDPEDQERVNATLGTLYERHASALRPRKGLRGWLHHQLKARSIVRLHEEVGVLYRQIYGPNAAATVELDAQVPRTAATVAEAKMFALADALGTEIGLRTAQAYFFNQGN